MATLPQASTTPAPAPMPAPMPAPVSTGPQATRLRAQRQGEVLTVRLLLSHAMDNGQQRDPDGRLRPAWFIQQVCVTLQGEVVLQAHWGPSVARDPFWQFQLRGVRAGESLAIHWVDNLGQRRSDVFVVP